MSQKRTNLIEIPDSKGSFFDHATFDAKTRRVFVAHTRHRSNARLTRRTLSNPFPG
jgi:hypothetical protein